MVAVMVGSMVIVEPVKDARLWWQPRDRDVGGRPMGCLTSGGGRDNRGARVVAHLVLQQGSPRPRHELPRGTVDTAGGQRSGSGATDAMALICLEVQLALLVPDIWGQGLPTPWH